MQIQKPRGFGIRALAHLLFWGFNIPMVLTVSSWFYLFLTSTVLSRTSFNDLVAFVPVDIVITFAIVLGMPFVSIIAVLVTRAYKSYRTVFQILYGIEFPIIAFTLARLFFLKTLNPFNSIILLTAAIAITTYIIYLFVHKRRSRLLLSIQTLIFQSAVIVGVYASLLMAFFLPIVAAMVINAIKEMFRQGSFQYLTFYPSLWAALVSIIAFISFATLFLSLIATPFVGLYLYYRAWRRTSRQLKTIIAHKKYRPLMICWTLAYVLTTIIVAYQGSTMWLYSRMDVYQRETTYEGRRQQAQDIITDRSVQTRLVNTYLAHYRYLTDKEMTMLSEAYKNEIKLDDPSSQAIQQAFTTLAFPFVYGGKFEEDVKKAGEYYQNLYDEPIQLAQGKRVSNILSTSFEFTSDPLKSSVLDREDKDVRLVNRTIKALPDQTSTFATVNIEEEYENLTNSPQEVYYLFSLPQDSVVTDLRIGADLEIASENLQELTKGVPAPTVTPVPTIKPTGTPFVVATPIPQKSQGEIAAKGAANTVYENQYQPRIDPAILEQVGPRQYKLRVYPIPVKEENLQTWQKNQLTVPVRNQKMRLTYVTPIAMDGSVTLPQKTETRNITADRSDERTFPVTSTKTGCVGQIQTLSNTNAITLYIPHQENSWLPQATDNRCDQPLKNSETDIHEQHIAILADTSYSMGNTNWKDVLEKELQLSTLLESNNIDLYYFNDFVSRPISLNQEKNNPKIWNAFSFGKTDRLSALKSVADKYDAVFMFTDDSEADATGSAQVDPRVTSPIYVIHPEGKLPKLPDNLTYYLQVNGAQENTSGETARQQYSAYLRAKAAVTKVTTIEPQIMIGETGIWITFPASTPPQTIQSLITVPTSPMTSVELQKLAHKYEIQAQMRFAPNRLHDLDFLDGLQAQAVSDGIVTPFSSLIVLTTDQQREQLRRAATQANRFTVGYDLGEQQLVNPASGGLLGTSAVPEPGEWVLMFTAGLSLAYVNRKRLLAHLRSTHHA